MGEVSVFVPQRRSDGQPCSPQHPTLQLVGSDIDVHCNDPLQQAWSKCTNLARDPNILNRVAEAVERLGLVGEQRAVKLIYLILTSRLLPRPLSGVVKGPSGSGKSHTVEKTLPLFPPSATMLLSGLSDRGLVYLPPQSLKHKILVVAEAAGLGKGDGAYFLRSFLSEGRLGHATADLVPGGRGKITEQEGPTGLLVTTTKSQIDPELETRMFSIPIDDSNEQTARVMLANARQATGLSLNESLDCCEWIALQEWLELAEHRVVVPFAEKIAERTSATAVRLRRDFPALLTLVKTHALLQQANRPKDDEGRIQATLADYSAVYALVSDILREGIDAGVPATTRDTVEAIQRLEPKHPNGVPQKALVGLLGLDKSVVSRRVHDALERGHLRNEETRRGQSARLVLGEPLPEEVHVLPTPEDLRRVAELPVAAE